MIVEYYLNKLNVNELPNFLKKYLECPSLKRLKKVGYFCGMDYASKDIYDFSEYISRYDHSLSVSLLTYRLTQDKKSTIAALFHDIATPCFSHVIDYMNNDYSTQESTEEYTEKILLSDTYFLSCLKKDNIDIEDVINFKRYSIVDNDRPKLCADRLDGVILTGIGWTKNVTIKDIDNILDSIAIFLNENGENEIGFTSLDVLKHVVSVSESIDIYCHSKEDNYMMMLLAEITKYAINKGYITYEELYVLNEEELFDILNGLNDNYLQDLLYIFKNVKLHEVPYINLEGVKIRNLNPLILGKRYK